jgi:hypothetical protein
MLREVNTHVLIDLKLNAHQYIILILLMNGFHDHLEEYLEETNSKESFPDDLTYMSQLHLVSFHKEKPYDVKSIVVQSEFISSMSKDDGFIELFETYPNKVMRPNGVIDYLRKDKRMCKDIYSIITKDDRSVHEHIMKCLRYELKYRERNNALQWMKRLSKWLSGREWENFEDQVDDRSLQQTPGNDYGTKLE